MKMIRKILLLSFLCNCFSFAQAANEDWRKFTDLSGPNGSVHAIATYKDNIYIGGSFTSIDEISVNRVAKWNGNSWIPLGQGVNDMIHALTVDSSGALYAAGKFTTAGGLTANRIAKWDGNSWSSIGGNFDGDIYSLAIDKLGNLFVGGAFTAWNGGTGNYIAKWDGAIWSSPYSNLDGAVTAIAFNSANTLFVGGGTFLHVGGAGPRHLTKWNGSWWAEVGSGTGTFGQVRVLLFDEADNLYAGSYDGGVRKFDGIQWLTLGSEFNKEIRTLLLDSNNNLYAGGEFLEPFNRIARWNGSIWESLGDDVNSIVYALAFDENSDLIVGGNFSIAGGQQIPKIAKYLVNNFPLNAIYKGTSISNKDKK